MTKKALFLAGGWEGHEPQETSRFISNVIERYDIESDIINDLDILGEKNKLEKYDIILPVWTMGRIDDNNWNSANEVTMGTAITNFLKLSSENMNTILIYPVPEIGCDPYKYNLNHKRSSGKELQTLSFPVEEYDKRNNFVVGI